MRTASSAAASQQFVAPPILHTRDRRTRTAGFELEYAGLTIAHSARIVQAIFGGEVEPISTFVHHVHTPTGRFAVEIDAAVLKEKQYEKPLRAIGFDPDKHDVRWLEEALLGAASTVVPIEISAPPLPIDQLDPLDELRAKLREARAKGTRASLLYAFGLHINPEVVDPHDINSLRDHLRAVILLYPWLKKSGEIDLSRRLCPYINPFSANYARLILQPDYAPDQDRIIDDYLEFNPTRNRPLDMTPLFVLLDRDRVVHRMAEMHLVKARPTFHYRLPNCMIDEDDWTLASEWNRWVIIERLAHDRPLLARMAWEYLEADREALHPIVNSWPKAVAKYVKRLL